MRNEFTAVFAKDKDGGYRASCLEVPEATGHGATVEACRQALIASTRQALDARRKAERETITAVLDEGNVTARWEGAVAVQTRTHNEVTVVFFQDGEAPYPYGAWALEIPSNGQGKTLEACRAHLIEGLQLMLDVARTEERLEAQAGAWDEIMVVEG